MARSSEHTEEEWDQFLFAASMEAPLIGTFEPTFGDLARDNDTVGTRVRMWTGTDWRPSFAAIPHGK